MRLKYGIFTILILFMILSDCSSISEDFKYDTLININPALNMGPFNLKIGTNCGPFDMSWVTNNSEKLKELGVKIIRTHDYYGPCDWYTIFPDWSKDENEPSSYNFKSTDKIVNDIIANGFELFFRLGPSWHDENYPYNNDPPGTIRDQQGNITHIANNSDFDKFATICNNIQRHYNKGWAQGFYFNIIEWEIWNEPSLNEHFWTGTPEQFYQMFEKVYRQLKSNNKNYHVGGPGLAGQFKESYSDGLLNYLSKNQIFPSFFSWHHYGSGSDESGNSIQSPEVVKERAEYINTILKKYSFTSTNSICTEWNSGINQNNFTDTGRGAAYFAGILKVFCDKNVTQCFLYRGDDHPLGIFDNKGELKTGSYSLKAWKNLTLNANRVYCDEKDEDGLYIISSKKDGSGEIGILISNLNSEDRNIRFIIKNLSGYGSKSMNYSIDEIADSIEYVRKTEDSVQIKSSTITIDTILSKESVQFIRIFN